MLHYLTRRHGALRPVTFTPMQTAILRRQIELERDTAFRNAILDLDMPGDGRPFAYRIAKDAARLRPMIERAWTNETALPFDAFRALERAGGDVSAVRTYADAARLLYLALPKVAS